MLKLYGIVVDCTGDTLWLSGHNDTLKKVRNTATSWNRIPPIQGGKIKIRYNIGLGLLPFDIIGKKVKICVNIKKYQFTSKYDHNKGEHIKGMTFHLTKCDLDADWSNFD